MIRIVQKPKIAEYDDRWGRLTGEFYVSANSMYLTEDKWQFINEFQNFKFNGVDSIPEMRRLLNRSLNSIYQFEGHLSLQFDHENQINCEDTVRARGVAVIGMVEWVLYYPEYEAEIEKLQLEVNEINKTSPKLAID